jgi:hypothetical protein
MLLFILTVACEDKSLKMDYEEIIIKSYRSYSGDDIFDYTGGQYQINLIACNQHYYKKIYFHTGVTGYGELGLVDALKDYTDTIYRGTPETVRKYKIEIFRDTLTKFHMPIGGRVTELI